MIKEKLENWAERAIALYNEIGKEKNLSFYTQSPLNKLVDNQKVEVMIIGINPGSEGDYESMLSDKAWTSRDGKIDKMPAGHLLKGNYNWDKSKNCTSWDIHIKWPYFQGLMRYFSRIGESNILLDETRFVLTNMTFLNTKNKKDLNNDILPRTISHTIDLIKIIKPKMIVFLDGGEAFGYLNNLEKIEFQDLRSKYTIKKVKSSSIHVGSLCGIPCYGIRHPAHAAEEEFLHISTFLKLVHSCEINDLPTCDEINRQCYEAVKFVEKAKTLTKAIQPRVSETGAITWIYQHEVLVNELSTNRNSNTGDFQKTVELGKKNIAIVLTPNENMYDLTVFWRNIDNSNDLEKLLESANIEFRPYTGNPNRHYVTSFDFGDDETIKETVTKTVQTLKDAIVNYITH